MNYSKNHFVILLFFLILPIFLSAQVNKRAKKQVPVKQTESQRVQTKQVDPAVAAPTNMKVVNKADLGIGTVTDYKGKKYDTRKVGDQWWIMQPFHPNYNAYGMEIPQQLPSAWGDPTLVMDNGYIYKAITQDQQTDQFMGLEPSKYSDANPSGIQGLCPIGWHLPSLAEYEELFEYYGGRDVAAPKMRDELGFKNASYWTTSGSGAGIYFIELRDYTDQVQVFQNTGNYHHSIRCVKDE